MAGDCAECCAFERELKNLETELNEVLQIQPPEYYLSLIDRDLKEGRDLYRHHLMKVHEVLEPEWL